MTIGQALKSGVSLTHKNLRLLFLQIILNAAALGLFYLFLQTPEASVAELTGSLVVALITLFIFALTQAGTFGAVAQAATGGAAGGFFRQGLRNSWRFLLAMLPVALLGSLLFLGRSFASKKSAALMSAKPSVVLLGVVWYVVLPLMLVTLWSSVSKNGLAYSLKNSLRLLFRRALSPRWLSVYLATFLLFAVVPYVLLAVKTPIRLAWLEFSVFMLRLVLAYVLAIYGWTIMAGAMVSLMADGSSQKADG